MTTTPDRSPGPSDEERTDYDVQTGVSPTSEGQLLYSDGQFKMQDSAGVFDPRAGGGISEAQHRSLRHLIHFIGEGPAGGFASGATKVVTGGMFPTLIEWKDSTAKLIVTKEIVRSGGGASLVRPTPITWKMYDTDGSTVLLTVSDAIVYSGIAVSSVTRTIA